MKVIDQRVLIILIIMKKFKKKNCKEEKSLP